MTIYSSTSWVGAAVGAGVGAPVGVHVGATVGAALGTSGRNSEEHCELFGAERSSK